MNKTPFKNILKQTSSNWLQSIFLFIISINSSTLYAEKPVTKHIQLFYTQESPLELSIFEKIHDRLQHQNDNIIITKNLVHADNKNHKTKRPDLIIAIGLKNIQHVKKQFSGISKLFIVSSPHKITDTINKNETILLMTQPYCRQFHFISLLNTNWETIGLLESSDTKPTEQEINHCATKQKLELIKETINDQADLSRKIKNILKYSDALLAVPNKKIYNKRTVKNILLTSYRYRKPVIAFSQNFVTAGAAASIYSNLEQISETASNLARRLLENKKISSINHPENFTLKINKQVFNALEIPLPNLKKIKNIMEAGK